MKIKSTLAATVVFFLFGTIPFLGQKTTSAVQKPPRVELFSPQKIVKQVRQVRARFSEAMVPLGDPREVVAPFDINCPEKGSARWADTRNWIYDFERDLPAGVRCEFTLKDGLKTLVGNVVTGQKSFSFSTGGPSILSSVPYQGSESVDEEQIFILELDAVPTEASVLANVYFSVQGIADRVGIRIVTGPEREKILKSQYRYRRAQHPRPLLLIQAKQRFPEKTKISLVWGKSVATSGGATNEKDQVLPFITRGPFVATFSCPRENPQKDCVPISPLELSFSASVAWDTAKKIVLKGSNGRVWHISGAEPQEEEKFVNAVSFEGPFPEKSEFQIEIPPNVEDDAGRKLTNADRFPLTVKTDEYPPLAKFAADFGILELNADPMLPVTLRNVEPTLAGKMLELAEGQPTINHSEIFHEDEIKDALANRMKGSIYRVPSDKVGQMALWIDKVASRRYEDRDKSVFNPEIAAKAKTFSVPKLHGSKSFEVIGIPLKQPGFYVVEIQSELLGAALLGVPKPMYVPTTVLVTNLSVHFKWGIESSLAWVTTLDQAKPVNEATIQIRDCKGDLLWEGRTDSHGLARVNELPAPRHAPECSYHRLDNGLLVSARLGEDMAFVHTSWDEGIESWRFNLPTEYDQRLVAAHTIFDRTLFHAGETVHMKHLLRRHLTGGFGLFPEKSLPQKVTIQHFGSDQKYELPVTWDANGVAENTWTIPKEAKLGRYEILFAIPGGSPWNTRVSSGDFRVEEFRVPLMRGSIRFPKDPLVAATEFPVDMTVSFLAGGGAGNLPVKFRHHVQPASGRSLEGFEDFVFSNGAVKEGIVRGREEEEDQEEKKPYELKSTDMTLDRTGSVRTTISGLPVSDRPLDVLTELEFRDPNGAVQTVASHIPMYPSNWVIGIKPDSWALSKDSLKFQVAVLDLNGKPVSDAAVHVDLLQRKNYSHRKRLVGGFYAYESYYEVKKFGPLCDGKTDRRGLLLCESVSSISGNLILQASTRDSSGHPTVSNRDVWVAGKDQWWFPADNGDRIDVLPEKKRYEPGETARFQVRMPFPQATALVSVEREGIAETFVKELSGKAPVIELPVKGNFAPDVFVSVLVVRGRISDVQPTALVDLGRPAYKLGIAEISVGWRAHELKVKVSTDRSVYKIREKVKVGISVRTADAKTPPLGSEVAVAAVDEGLLELMPNQIWAVLKAMMGHRAYGVQTFTAQTYVIGKRHFGLKALPSGGGGGRQTTRELFDTLLLWSGRVKLDSNGEATLEVPLNDSLTSFRIVAVATSGLNLYGTGSTSIRSTQDLMILSGIAPIVRQGDDFRSEFTVRNASERPMKVQVAAQIKGLGAAMKPIALSLASGESKIVGWNLTAPTTVESLRYEIEARSSDGSSDRMAVVQKVVPAIPVRTFQATLLQVDQDVRMEVERPKDAQPGRGGVQVLLRPSLVDGLAGVTEYMKNYPYYCLEQEVSRAVALRDEDMWNKIMGRLPSFLDADGLAKYFPSMLLGSDVLTSYLIAISNEAGWKIPPDPQARMTQGLRGFIEGRVIRYSSLPTTDLSIRKLAAVEALSRLGQAQPNLLSSITLEPNLWPTSAVIDWLNVLERMPNVAHHDERFKEAEQILRSRLNFQGTTLGFSTERTDYWWWLMVSVDSNSVRLILPLLNSPDWKEDVPRLIRGALGRQHRGRWSTTVANAWGVLAMEKFSKAFEQTPVTGTSTASLNREVQTLNWSSFPKGQMLSFPWPPSRSELTIAPATTGKPWATIQSLAAIPLKEPFSSGYKIKKTLTPVEQKKKGSWSVGDIVRVRLELEAQADMTWVVVSDPIPAGASILGTGLGRESTLATRGEIRKGWVWPAFEERSMEAFRSYYEFVPKGEWTVEYTLRLNNEGVFNLPPSRVEAMYSPEMFGEIPNESIRVFGVSR